MRHFFGVVFCLCCVHPSFSSVFDTVFKVEPAMHQRVIRQVYRSAVLQMDSARAMAALEALEADARAAGERDVELYSIGYQGAYLLSRSGKNTEPGKRLFMQAIEGAETYGLPELKGYFTFFLGYALYRRKAVEEALVYMFEGMDDMATIGYRQVPSVELCLFLTGDLYFDFDNYDRALAYYREALKHCGDNTPMRIMTYNKMAAAQVEMKNYGPALHYFNRGIHLADSLHDTLSLAFLQSNLAQLYIELADLDRAEPLLRFACEQGSRLGQESVVLSSLLQQAVIATQRGAYEEAAGKVAAIKQKLAAPNTYAMEALVEYYQVKSRLCDATGQYKEASAYKDSVKLLRDSISVERDANMLANMRAQITAERHKADLLVLEKEKEIQRILRNVTLAGAVAVVLLLTGLFYAIWRKQRRARQQYKMEKEDAERKLRMFRSNIQRKNQLIESFRQQLEYQPVAAEANDREVLHEQLYQSIILTEEDWLEFKKLFERVYPDFITQLQVKYPELTSAEIRLLTLLKLNLSTSEIAGMLGILPQSVRKTRSRLMKKLDVADHKHLPSFLDEL